MNYTNFIVSILFINPSTTAINIYFVTRANVSRYFPNLVNFFPIEAFKHACVLFGKYSA